MATHTTISELFKDYNKNNYATCIQSVYSENSPSAMRVVFKPRYPSDMLIPDYIVSNCPLTFMTIQFSGSTITTIPLKFINEIDGFDTNKFDGKFTYNINWKKYICEVGLRLIIMQYCNYTIIVRKDSEYESHGPSFCCLYCKIIFLQDHIRNEMIRTPNAMDHFKTIYSERILLHSGRNEIKINTDKSCIKGIFIEGYNERTNEILFKAEGSRIITILNKVTDNIIELRFRPLESINLFVKEFTLVIDSDHEEETIEIMIYVILQKTLTYACGMAGITDYIKDY